MILPLAGSAGMGLLWGWVTGSYEGRISHAAWTVSALLAATSAIALVSLLFSGPYGLAAFLVSSVCAAYVHTSWRRSLRQMLVPEG